MMAITYEENCAELHKINGRKRQSLVVGTVNHFPALLDAVTAREELAIEVGDASLAADDLFDRHRCETAMTLSSDDNMCAHLAQRQEIVWSATDPIHKPTLPCPKPGTTKVFVNLEGNMVNVIG
jgi:hypothetical protein